MTTPTFAPNENNRDSAGKLLYGVWRNGHRSQKVTVGTSAVLLPINILSRRLAVAIFNNSTSIIYLGAADVLTTSGYPIYPRGQFIVPIDDNIEIYAISADSGLDVRIWEGG